MGRDKRIALIVFLAGVATVAGYALWTLFGPDPVPPEMPANDSRPQIELTIAGEANGTVVITLFPDIAPQNVARILTLARAGAYDGVVFHRVIDGFMAQTGDVEFGRAGGDLSRAGTGGSDLPDLPAEFAHAKFLAGTVGMARAADPDSANSQFFIMFEPADFLDGKYTVVGQVASGFDVVKAIKKGDPALNGAIAGDPDVMVSVKVLADGGS